jgi:hypothetical protein
MSVMKDFDILRYLQNKKVPEKDDGVERQTMENVSLFYGIEVVPPLSYEPCFSCVIVFPRLVVGNVGMAAHTLNFE